MSYQLRPDESLKDAVVRIADEQMRRAVRQLRHRQDDPEEAIHDARKCFKKIRALLRLVRSQLGSKTYARENARFRDAGRDLSAARDAAVAIRTLDALCENDDTADFTKLRAELAQRSELGEQRSDADEAVVARVVASVRKSRKRIADWPTVRDDFSALRGGLGRAYRSGRRARKRAFDNPVAENFHELRKRVKDYWYHIRILRPVRPKIYGRLASRLKSLSEALGDYHDLSMLRVMVESTDFDRIVKNRKILFAMIEQKQKKLRKDIRPACARVYRVGAKRFIERIEADWSAWR